MENQGTGVGGVPTLPGAAGAGAGAGAGAMCVRPPPAGERRLLRTEPATRPTAAGTGAPRRSTAEPAPWTSGLPGDRPFSADARASVARTTPSLERARVPAKRAGLAS